MKRKLMGIIKVDFDAIGQLLIIYSIFFKYLRKKWEYNEAVHQLFIDFKQAYDSGRRGALYNILIQFGIPKRLVRPMKMFLAETYSGVRVGKNLCEIFPIRNGLNHVLQKLFLLLLEI
jgi:hypothetical protein